MAPRASSRVAASEKTKTTKAKADTKVEKAAVTKKATKPTQKKTKAASSTTKANTAVKRATTPKAAVNGKPMKAATGAKRGRPKTSESVEPAPKANNKRKPSEEENGEARAVKKAKAEEPAAKAPAKTKAAAKPTKTTKPKALPKQKLKLQINQLPENKPLNVFVFGEGSGGELGLGTANNALDVKRPRLNPLLKTEGVVRLAAGGMHCVALTHDNKILTWGVNDNSALGRDTTNADQKMREIGDGEDSNSNSGESDSDDDSGLNPKEAIPTAIPSDSFPEGTTFVDVAAGDSSSFALTDDGLVYGWGTFRSNEGVLGFTPSVKTAETPILVDGVEKIKQIACGANHVLALDIKGKIWAWGSGQQCQLGRRLLERSLHLGLKPTKVGFTGSKVSKNMRDISAGDYHSFAIGEDDNVWSFGANSYGETGHVEDAGADNAHVTAPKVVSSLKGLGVAGVDGGAHHSIAWTKDGQCFVWGRCDGGQVGMKVSSLQEDDLIKDERGAAKILMQPTPISAVKGCTMASAGPDHAIAIDKDGKAWSWGFSANYQTGLGETDDVDEATMIKNKATENEKLTWVGCGGQFSVLASFAGLAVNGVAPGASVSKTSDR